MFLLLVVRESVDLIIVPVLIVLAWRGWIKSVRRELPSWRNGVGSSALSLLSLYWLGIAALEVPSVLSRWRVARPTDLESAMLRLHPLETAVVVLAFALRRDSRAQAIIAGLLMSFAWPAGYF